MQVRKEEGGQVLEAHSLVIRADGIVNRYNYRCWALGRSEKQEEEVEKEDRRGGKGRE